MWLQNGLHSVLVTHQGGSILHWQQEEHFILGPARDVRVSHDKVARRGESHWCFPNFGTPPRDSGQPKHGRLRQIELRCPTYRESNSVTFGELHLERGIQNPVADVAVQVRTVVSTEAVRSTLRVVNLSNKRTPILPAFHPYFAVPKDGLEVVGGIRQLLAVGAARADVVCDEPSVFKYAGPVFIRLNNIGCVKLHPSDGCQYLVLWSDQPESYVCVEPVWGKPGTFGTEEGHWLEHGQHVEYSVTMRFERFEEESE